MPFNGLSALDSPHNEAGQRLGAVSASGNPYTENDNFAPLMHWLEPLVAHILWQSKTVAGYIPPTLMADAMQEGFLRLWLRLHDEPEFIEGNTKSYIAQWVAWQGKDRLLYGNGHKRWAKHTLSSDALQHHLLSSGSLDNDPNDKLDMLTDVVDASDLVNLFFGEVNSYTPANAHGHRYPQWTLAVENRIDLEQAITTLAERYLVADDVVRLFALVAVTTTSSTRDMAQVVNMPYHTFRKRAGQVRTELRELLSPPL